MLSIYKNLFTELNSNKIKYCVYKGLNHLTEDLDGERGDLDIIIEDQDKTRFLNIAHEHNFLISKVNNDHFYLFAIDLPTQKTVMIDFSTKIYAGPKPFKYLWMKLDFNKIKINTDIVPILSKNDYTLLMFLIRIMSRSEKREDLLELKDLIHNSELNESYLMNSINHHSGKSSEDLIGDITNANNWDSLKEGYSSELKKIYTYRFSVYLNSKIPIFFKIKQKVKRLLGFPSYRVNKRGRLIAFMGVDGAGKTSAVDYVLNLDVMKHTGVKRIYFGSNEYWIPGLHFLLIKSQNWPSLFRLPIGTLSLLDRQFRSLNLIYHLMLGKTVLADRYVYDEFIGRKLQVQDGYSPTFLKRIYRKVFGIKMLIKPDLTLFLDVSPEVAFQRKQDYSFEHMLKVNQAYKDFFYKMPSVQIINCDQDHETVLENIVQKVVSNVKG